MIHFSLAQLMLSFLSFPILFSFYSVLYPYINPLGFSSKLRCTVLPFFSCSENSFVV